MGRANSYYSVQTCTLSVNSVARVLLGNYLPFCSAGPSGLQAQACPVNLCRSVDILSQGNSLRTFARIVAEHTPHDEVQMCRLRHSAELLLEILKG